MSVLLAGMLADASLRALAAALAVAGILAALAVRESRVQHAAWTAVLVAMLLMPVLPFCIPGFTIPLPGAATAAMAPSRERNRPADETYMGRTRAERLFVSTSPAVAGSQSASDPAPRSTPASSGAWIAAALVTYGGGVLLLLVRAWLGWQGARRLARTGRLVQLPPRGLIVARGAAIAIRESPLVVTPVTIGVIAPVILLPVDWTTWPGDTLDAILAHEIAHVRRRDPLVNSLAHLNCCLFWFHPLSWWLERALAAAAEHVCDEAAIRETGRAEYARVLLDLTRSVRARGGRLAWRHVGMVGSGMLGQRIDRVLHNRATARVSFWRRATVAGCCGAAVFVAAACHPRRVATVADANVSLEQRDHTLRAQLRTISLGGPQLSGNDTRAATPERIDALETALARNPDDRDALKELLIAYWMQPAPQKRRAHILHLITQHPEADLAGALEARIFEHDLYHSFVGDPPAPEHSLAFPGDDAGAAQAEALWLAHVSPPTASPAVLGNASYFFETIDAGLADRLLRRARRLDPQGPWAARLGRLYALVLAGARVASDPTGARTISRAAPQSAFGLAVRQQLAESRDDTVLTASGWFLARASRRPWVDFDPDVWAEACFKRALLVNPAAVLAHSELLRLARQREATSSLQALWIAPPASRYESIAALPETERFEQLPRLARSAYQDVRQIAHWDDPNLRDRVALAREQARRFSEDALRLAPRYRTHPRYGSAIFTADLTLGSLALDDGKAGEAVAYLRKASRAPGSEELAYSDGLVSGWRRDLPGRLLDRGERLAVADFLERIADINIPNRLELREAAARVRHNLVPDSIQ